MGLPVYFGHERVDVARFIWSRMRGEWAYVDAYILSCLFFDGWDAYNGFTTTHDRLFLDRLIRAYTSSSELREMLCGRYEVGCEESMNLI